MIDNAILFCTDFNDIDWLRVALHCVKKNKVTHDVIYIAHPSNVSTTNIDFDGVIWLSIDMPVLPDPIVGKVPPSIYKAQLIRLAAIDYIKKYKLAANVLYLDNDIMIFGDVGALFSLSQSPLYAVLAADAGTNTTHINMSYFYSGVMKINIESFYAEIGIENLMEEFVRVYEPSKFVYSDEEFLNTLISAEALNNVYNYQIQFNKRIKKDTVVLHFAWFKPEPRNTKYYVEYTNELILLLGLVDKDTVIHKNIKELLKSIDNYNSVFNIGW